jgi:predicted anti-sigma-YlaC factor YlaD
MFQKPLHLFFAGMAFALLGDVALTLAHEWSPFLEGLVGVVVLCTYVVVVGGLLVVALVCFASIARETSMKEGLRRIFQTRVRAFAMGFSLVFFIAKHVLELYGMHFLALPR